MYLATYFTHYLYYLHCLYYGLLLGQIDFCGLGLACSNPAASLFGKLVPFLSLIHFWPKGSSSFCPSVLHHPSSIRLFLFISIFIFTGNNHSYKEGVLLLSDHWLPNIAHIYHNNGIIRTISRGEIELEPLNLQG